MAISVIVGLAAATYFYAALFKVYSLPMYSWSFSGQTARSRIMLNLLNPRWLWRTLSSTEWPPAFLAVGLLLLLAADLALFGVLVSSPPLG
jgi:hypothetical protein